MTDKQRKNLELVKSGFANGISTQLAVKQTIFGPDARLTDEEKQEIINDAAFHYGEFLKALGVAWESDPNSDNTPKRVAKAYVNDLDSYEEIKLFFKLPSWFVISTPIGKYNPDWAFILQKNNHNTIYLVRETKSTTDEEELRPEEKNKVNCGKKHFNEIGVNFKTTKELSKDLIELLSNESNQY